MNPDDPPQDSPETHDAQPEQGQAYPTSPVPTSVYCVQCGYNLTGVAIGSTCPECGRTVAPSFHGQMLPTSGKAIASLVLGICSIPACVLYGIPAVICGGLAIFFAQKTKGQVESGQAGISSKNMATAGLVCGIIGLCLGLVYVIGIAVFVGFAIYSNP
jgi:hypothetical protein